MVDNLSEEIIPHHVKLDQYNNVTHIFFAFLVAIKMTILSHTVLLIDAKFKTNKYRMPLVHAIGISSTQPNIFGIIFVLLRPKLQTIIIGLKKLHVGW